VRGLAVLDMIIVNATAGVDIRPFPPSLSRENQ
jgi:hypothetical protein